VRRLRLALLATALLPLGGSPASAQAVASDPLAVLDRFQGAWAGPGTLHGSKTRLELRVDRALGKRFVRLQHKHVVEMPGRAMEFEGLALYRASASGFAATWFDSFGHVYPVTATLDGDTLRAEWGTGDTEQGLTMYRPTAPSTLEVTDSVKKAGVYQEFGRATLTKQ
jgi:hypothetical protein